MTHFNKNDKGNFELSPAYTKINEETTLLEGNKNSETQTTTGQNINFSQSCRRALIIIATILICIPFMIMFLVPNQVFDDFTQANPASRGRKIRFQTNFNNENVYIKVDLPGTNIVYGESYSRYQSSTFDMYIDEHNQNDDINNPCFRLKSMNGKWLALNFNNKISATANYYYYAYSFSSYHSDDNDPTQIKLKLCNKDEWLHMSYDVVAKKYNLELMPLLPATGKNNLENIKAEKAATVFKISEVDHYMGVNLGGWFIPEVWMLFSFFNGTGLGWGGSLCAMMNYSVTVTEARMEQHLKTWITEEDFVQMKAIGFNSFRLPIGYWNIIEDPYKRYAPLNLATSLHYIDWSFDMAKKYDMTVLLDLHGAPGSQNGQDHSGCGYSIIYPEWQKRRNVKMTLQAIDAMAKRYANHPNLIGIELMNEPSQALSEMNHTVLKVYYENAYKVVRKYSNTTYIIFNELYQHLYTQWNRVLMEPAYYNVIVDWHLYDWGGPHNDESKQMHIKHAKEWSTLIAKHSPYHPVVVGEWTMSTGTKIQGGQEFVNACIESFHGAFGWYIWNWKIEHNLGFYEWDVKYQFLKGPTGLHPFKNIPTVKK